MKQVLCPPDGEYEQMLGGSADVELVEALKDHLDRCPQCRQRLEQILNADTIAESLTKSGTTLDDGILDEKILQSIFSLRTFAADSLLPVQQGEADQKFDFLESASHENELGRLGPFIIRRVLGRGGVGIVFEADHQHLERRVALKVIRPERAADSLTRKRFLREAKAACKISSDYVATVYEMGEANGVVFIAMEFLTGRTLNEVLSTNSKLPIPIVLRIGGEVAAGMATVHAEGLVHRDIKPANIFLEGCEFENDGQSIRFRRAKILDFGLARPLQLDQHLTKTGTVIGTPSYMAPEQARGHRVDARSDLFSLGCVLYQMIAGQVPFPGPTLMQVLHSLTHVNPPPLTSLRAETPSMLDNLVFQLLSRDPAGRPADMASVVRELKAVEEVGRQIARTEPMALEKAYEFLSPPEKPDEIGRLDQYRVLTQLGSGGMGFVFHAEDAVLLRPVALKVMRPEVASQEMAKARFLREGRAAAKLKSEHIISIYQVAEANGVPYMALELLEGATLEDWLKKTPGPQPTPVLVKVARDVLKGLTAAHEKGLVHRDIKPANLWVETTSKPVKLLDFGLTRDAGGTDHVTPEGTMVGSPAYMAPEQARGTAVDGRTDLFSLGVVLYSMVSGSSPFQRDTILATLSALAMHEPPSLTTLSNAIPPAFSDFVACLLNKDPSRRPAHAKAALQELEEIEQSLKSISGPVKASKIVDSPNIASVTKWTVSGSKKVLLLCLGGLLAAIVLVFVIIKITNR